MSDARPSAAPTTLAWLILALATLAGAVLGSAGWATRLPDADLYPYVHELERLLDEGRMPVLGNVQSTGGFNPPGDAFLFLPGALLSNDVRVWPLPAALAFYVALVLGTRLLLARALRPTTATLAAAGFALSAGAIETAGTLWTRMQSPAFLVWTLAFLLLWAERRNAWWLSAALLTWFASLYVFPETLLAAPFFPIVWLLRRPPIRVAPLALVAAISLVVAWPYLAYEARHGFDDVLRTLTQRPRELPPLGTGWCDPTRALVTLDADATIEPIAPIPTGRRTGVAGEAIVKLAAMASMLVAIVARNGPAAAVLLVAMMLVAANALARIRPRRADAICRIAGVALLLVAIAASPTLIRAALGDRLTISTRALLTLHAVRALAAIAGVVLLVPRLRAATVARLRLPTLDDRLASIVWPTLALVAATVLLASAGRHDRGWQFWPFVVVVGLAGVDRWLAASRARDVAVLVVAAGLCANASLVARARSIVADGWAGRPSPMIELLDVAATRARERGESTLRLGVHVAERPSEFYATAADARARIAGGGRAYVRHRYGLDVPSDCPEGIGDADDLRIVGPPEPAKWSLADRPGEYDGWQTLATRGPLRLLERPTSQSPTTRPHSGQRSGDARKS